MSDSDYKISFKLHKEELKKKHVKIEKCDNSIRLERYLTTAQNVKLQGDTYYENMNFDLAYIFYQRLGLFYTQIIDKHNASKTIQYKSPVFKLGKDVTERIKRLEYLNESNKHFEQYMETVKVNTEITKPTSNLPVFTSSIFPPNLPTVSPSTSSTLIESSAPDPSKLFSSLSLHTVTSNSSSMKDLLSGGIKGDVKSYPVVHNLAWIDDTKLKPMLVPQQILDEFLKIAMPNTMRGSDGIETCGILAGKMQKGGRSFVVTELVVPLQTGTSDTCAMTDEISLLNHCMSRDLLTLGWIHTHPRQSCFMSSVDIHTHCGYQMQLPEAIAIVMAPMDIRNSVGIFQITDPPGLDIIASCKLTGFHKHREDVVIYSNAEHVQIRTDLAINVVDLRK